MKQQEQHSVHCSVCKETIGLAFYTDHSPERACASTSCTAYWAMPSLGAGSTTAPSERLAKHFIEIVLFVNVKYIKYNTFNKLKCYCLSNCTEEKVKSV